MRRKRRGIPPGKTNIHYGFLVVALSLLRGRKKPEDLKPEHMEQVRQTTIEVLELVDKAGLMGLHLDVLISECAETVEPGVSWVRELAENSHYSVRRAAKAAARRWGGDAETYRIEYLRRKREERKRGN